jgi:two-component system chemotaxis response regulator CheB
VTKIRVLVVDDSAFARKVVREVLTRAPDLEVIDVARDGLEAIEKAHALAPDVITLDLVMPGADGLAVLAALPREGPRVVVVSASSADSALVIAALEAGAIDVVQKPTPLATNRLYELADELIAAVRVAALAKGRRVQSSERALAAPSVASSTDILVLGTSTGGPQALTRLLSAIPENFPVPIAVVVHMPVGYTESLAERLDTLSPLHVVEASEGLVFTRGTVVIARAGANLLLERTPVGVLAHLDYLPRLSEPHRPSVNALFTSAADQFGSRALGVVLTGMGDDGLAGSRALKAAGGRILAESEASAVVYGMPRAVTEAGLVTAQAPLEAMLELIARRL